jgi:hypothetical protein
MIVPFHEPWMFHFLLIFKLFPIGYGPTPSKRKDIMLKQEIIEGFSLYNIERENPFWGKVFSLQGCKESKSPFLSEWEVWKRFFQVFWKYELSRWKCVKESSSIHWKFEVCEKKLFELLKVWSLKCVKESFPIVQVSSEISSLCNKRLVSDRRFFFSSLGEGSKISSKASNLLRRVCCSICVQNVFFSNGILESHGEV